MMSTTGPRFIGMIIAMIHPVYEVTHMANVSSAGISSARLQNHRWSDKTQQSCLVPFLSDSFLTTLPSAAPLRAPPPPSKYSSSPVPFSCLTIIFHRLRVDFCRHLSHGSTRWSSSTKPLIISGTPAFGDRSLQRWIGVR